MASIELRSVHKTYMDDVAVIRDVDLHVKQGEFCVFVGPSGCGKSTLLRMVAGLEDISSGELLIDGQRMNDTQPAKRGVAMVFQSYALFPHISVYDNLAFGMTLAKMDKALIRKKVTAAAQVLQLEHLLDRKPKALSGGQRQRVAIGRAIVREPGVFLFDEPLSNLDASLRVQTRFEIAKIHRDFGKASTIYVTHDQVEAMTLADRILLLNSGPAVLKEGSVAQCGSPLELYHRPRNLFVAGFIGSPKMNFLSALLLEGHADHARVQLPSGEVLDALVDASALRPGQPVTLGIRPEHALLGTATQPIVREVQWQERLGESTYLFLASGVANQPLVVKAPGQAHADTGQRVAISLPTASLHVFDENGHALERRIPIADLLIPHAA
ncbi:carbohydrate ABC transporter ATP-binding protein, CUT1 family (TC 3.A.1.1.-) [Rhodoferax sp. OV413]|uniref:ABC transporter ATP-binding protein n=1 Tax=Rhodoferax sp. OV413 TaxID=1855285 RepID=UPI000880D94C|nr:sn-glycerol-3-phosphate ABC transporter ATP-binding protein UgpC [Rhodoferax sp. OV413]SDP86603.1 carbohydrate ABC transporter ATP-binding protein, CUT1 family (TC 3.A.1.1.-) [Rhodoferax sp. OV413]